jgi:hypothetical protein
MNIYNKIFELMEIYENLLLKKTSNKNNNLEKNNETNKETKNKNGCKLDDEINNQENIFSNDKFFNYIFNNIKLTREKNEQQKNENLEDFSKFSYNDKNNLDLITIQEYQDKPKLNINNIIKKYIKNLYKKIAIKCHPDKNGDVSLFLKLQDYYDKNFLIGLLYINYKLNLKFPELNEIIINHIFCEIKIIQDKIIIIQNEITK